MAAASVPMGGMSEGNTLAMRLVHGPSGAVVVTVPPRDNGGDGSSFSPTDLCAVSLATCAATVMGLRARAKGYPCRISFQLEKEMQHAPRRLGRLVINYTIDAGAACDDEEFAALVAVGKTCPVRLSLHPDVIVDEVYARGQVGPSP